MSEEPNRPDRGGYLLRPGAVAALALVAGHTLAAGASLARWEFGLAVALLSVAGMFFAVWGGFRSAILWVVVFAGIGGAREAWLFEHDQQSKAALEKVTGGGVAYAAVTGRLAEFPRRSTSAWTLYLAKGARAGAEGRVAPLPSRVAVRIRTSQEVDELLSGIVPGDMIRAAGPLEPLPLLAGSGEREEWLRGRGAVAVLRARKIEYPGNPRGRWQKFLATAQRVGNETHSRIDRALPQAQASLLAAMMLGRTDGLTQEQRTAFQRSGLMHLFAVSGLHTMLVGGLMIVLLRWLGLRAAGRLALLAALLLFFACMVGLRSSVLRAALLLVAFESRELLRRPVEPLAALGSIASLLMIASPRVLWQADFQMSFICAATIVGLSPWMMAIQQTLGRRMGWNWRSSLTVRLLQLLIISAAIQLALAPVMARHFGNVSLVAPVANALFLPVATLCLYAAFPGAVLAMVWGKAGMMLISATHWPLVLMELGATQLARLPFAAWTGPPWPPVITAGLYILLFSGPWLQFRGITQPHRSRWHFVPAALGVACLLVWMPLARIPGSGVDVWFLDVGQGDAILIRTPEDRTALIDAGPEMSGWFLSRMLLERGIDHLDLLAATHADADHIGGMDDVLEAVPVRHVLVGGSLAETRDFAEMETLVLQQHLAVTTLRRGAVITLGGGAALEVIHPTDEFVREGLARNDASIVMRLVYMGRAVLLTGDAEESAERDIAASGMDITCDVLKAGHHGSRSSSSALLLESTHPATAIISCGRNNRYGHPARETMERFERRGISVYRTDRQGTIHLHIRPDGTMEWNTAR